MKRPLLTTLACTLVFGAFAQTQKNNAPESPANKEYIFSQASKAGAGVTVRAEKYPAGFEQDAAFRRQYDAGGPLDIYNREAEILDLRDAYSKHFRLADGKVTAVITSGPQHYLKNGLWHTILTDISPNTQAGAGMYPHANHYNEFSTLYGNDASRVFALRENGTDVFGIQAPKLVFLDAQGNETGSITLNAFQSATVSGNRITYKDVAPGIDLVAEQNGGGFKYSYVLKDQQAFAALPVGTVTVGISETLNMGPGFVNTEDGSDGRVAFSNGEKDVKFKKFLFYDSNDNQDRIRATEVKYAAGKISYAISAEWISDPMRVFPVYIDPTVTYTPTASVYWTGTVDDDGGCDFSTDNDDDDEIRVGFDDGTVDNDGYDGYAKFNINALPANACISNAYSRFYQFNFRNTQSGGQCWGNDDQLDYFYGGIGPLTFDPVVSNCDQIRTAIGAAPVYGTFNVFSGYTLGTANGWKDYNAYNLNAVVTSARAVQNFMTLSFDYYGSHSDPGPQFCCFCTPDNDDWIDYRGWSDGNRPQLVVTYETPFIIGSAANVSANNVCAGTNVTLTLTGGTNGSSGNWAWYSGSCGGTLVGTSTASNAALTIPAPATTTTYFVRGQNVCGNTTCQSVTLTVLANSTAATSINATSNPICLGSTTTLSVAGGSLGAGAQWQWYSGSCGGVASGSGTAILVSPTTTTTYYARAEGTCNTTVCASLTVTVNTPTVAGSLNASATSVCQGSNFNLTLSGQTGSVVQWERDLNGGGFSSIGNAGLTTITESGLAQGTYTYRVRVQNGVCAAAYSGTVVVNIIPASAGGNTYAFNPALCQGNGTLISLSGQVGTILYWEQQLNGGGYTNIGSAGSASLVTGVLAPGVYDFRAVVQSGACTTATSAVATVTVSANTVAGTAAIVPDTICIGTPLTVNLGGQTGSVLYWERDISGSGYSNIGAAGANPLTVTPNTAGLHTYRAIVQSGACPQSISVSDIVYVKPLGNASFSYTNNTYCTNGSSDPLPAVQTPGGTFSAAPAGLVFLSTSTGQIDVSASAAGTYTVTHSLPTSFCNATATFVVTINSGAVATLNYPGSSFCTDDPAPYPTFAPGAGGNFTASPSGLVFGSSFGDIDLQGSAAGTYTVSYTVGGACPSTATQVINVKQSPVLTIGGPSVFCDNGALTQINATPAGGLFTGGVFITGGGQFNPGVAGAGVHSIVYQYTAPNGCAGFATTNIQVNPSPVVNVTTPAPLCSNGTPFALNATPGGGTWSGSPFVNSGGLFDPSLSGPGTFNPIYSYTDVNGCTGAGSTSVIVNTAPNAAISAQPVICSTGIPVQLNAVNAGGTWSGGPYINATGMFDPAVSGSGAFSVTYTLSSGGCTASSTQSVLVTQGPNASISPVSALCTNATPVQLISATSGGTFAGGAFVSSAGIFDPAAAGVGTHAVTYTVTQGSCSATGSTQINVIAAPSANITGVLTHCSADSAFFISATPVGGTYSGNPYISIAGLFYPQLSGQGLYPVVYSVSAGNGCVATDTVTLTINQSPDATFAPGSTMCTSDGLTTFAVNSGGGTWSGGAYITAAGVFDPAAAGAGSHPLTYTVSNAGCSDTYTTFVNVTSAPNVQVLSALNYCFNDGSQMMFGNIPGGVWTGGSYISGAGLFDPQISGTGTHLVVYTVTGGNGCAGFDSVYVNINANPDATITYPGTVCENAGIQTLTAVTSGGTWGGGPYVNSNTFDPAVAGLGSHLVTYSVTSGQGCSASASITVTVDPLPVALFNNQNNGLTVYFTDISQNAQGWTWNFGDGSADVTTQNPVHQFPDNGTYQVRLIISNGCGNDTIIRSIYVNKALSLDESDADFQINAYPNPASDVLNITLQSAVSGKMTLEIIDMQGKVINIRNDIKSSELYKVSMPVQDLLPGMYTVRLRMEDAMYTVRFVKQP
ncbi:MAG: T9SS type A sorting domain-containing protein [Bacteroidia bacterium]|nr:T9SS type A sorting domain-containing protein [Bacteroidia bacterium]